MVNNLIANFKNDLDQLSSTQIIRKHLTFGDCYALSSSNYRDLKEEISEFTQVHPNEIIVVGSAKLGFSIAPRKRYRPFSDRSDLDVAIVSDIFFDKLWNQLFQYKKLSQPWHKHDQFSRYLFRGWIRPDKFPPSPTFPYSDKWFEFFRELSKREKYGEIKISAGVYRSWAALEAYQESCIIKCQQAKEVGL